MGLFGNTDNIIKNAKSNQINVSEGTLLVVPAAGAFDDINEKATGLTFTAKVESSLTEGVNPGDEIEVTITGGRKPKTAGEVLGNLNQGFKPGQVTTEKLVLENVAVGKDGKVTSSWGHKAGGASRHVVDAVVGVTAMSFRYQGEDGKRRNIYIAEGDKNEERLEMLEKQLERWKAAYAKEDEKAIKEERINVTVNTLYPSAAVEVTGDNLVLIDAVQGMAKEGANLVQMRVYNPDTMEGLVMAMGVSGDDNADAIMEKVAKQAERAIRRNPNAEALIAGGNTRIDIIPANKVWMVSNQSDAARNGTIKYVENYINASEASKDFMRGVQKSGQYMSKTLIFSAYTDKDGDPQVGGVLNIVRASSDDRSNILALKTANVEGISGLPRPDKDDKKAEEGEHDHPADDVPADDKAAEEAAEKAAETPAEDMAAIPDFDDDASERKAARPRT
ncbi:hypothetical protein [Thiolapillus sp.]|uniref:hypothetical protein n=1 Tax=Thiolapillus sp. TaxID=2017437 RepID=UPI003AF97431